MRNKKVQYTAIIQGAMLIINLFSVCSICMLLYVTTEKIRQYYKAREFLNLVKKIPENPRVNLAVCMSLMIFLGITFAVRQRWKRFSNIRVVMTLVLDLLICSIVIFRLDFNYNGLLFLVFANIIGYAKDGKMKLLFVILAILGYLVADYNLLSIYIPIYNLSNYIQYYPTSVQQYLYSGYHILCSLNIILFITYCVYVISEQRGTIEEVNFLYHELRLANEQLSEYADMSERMAQTKERNRLAREIHDTLGHTLTGIAVGLDACMALMDCHQEQAKVQLKKLSEISREGIKDIRRSVNELRADALERLSLDLAIRKMVTDMSQMSKVQIFFDTDEKHLKFDEDEENVIYRVIQESITNAVRHGNAKKIWISLKRINGEIILVIHDNGTGCEKLQDGFGMKHIRERIELLKGTVTFNGKDGFTVTAHIPIRWGETYD